MEKVFCVSVQRTGTKAVGKFLRDNGYKVCGWPECAQLGLSRLWYEAKFDQIFRMIELQGFDGFEDSPWWFPGFHNEIFKHYPSANYILLERDPRSWFNSMATHSSGKNPGVAKFHAKIYDREDDLKWLIDNFDFLNIEQENIMDITNSYTKYVECYKQMTRSCRNYLEGKGARLFYCRLEEMQWQDLGKFLGIQSPIFYNGALPNKTTDYMKDQLASYVRSLAFFTSQRQIRGHSRVYRRVRKIFE